MLYADARPHAGLGHITRTASIARAMTDIGWTCSFATSHPRDFITTTFECAGTGVETFGNVDTRSLRQRWQDGCAVLVTDHYGIDAEFESGCRGWCDRIVVLDDLADRPHDCDFLVDAGAERSAADYAGLVPDHCRLLFGISYVPLRPGFQENRRQLSSGRIRKNATRILVNLGGAPDRSVLDRVLSASASLDATVAIDLMIASEDLARDVERQFTDVTIHVNVDNPVSLIDAADIAFGAAGVSAWERCCLGLPGIVLILAENQRPGALTLSESGAAIVFEADVPTDKLGHALRRLIADYPARQRMSKAAAMLCDGNGAMRIAGTIGKPRTF